MLRGCLVLATLCAAAAGLAGCGDPALRAAGEPCFASSECGPGLVCDLAAEQPICASMGSGGGGVVFDAAGPPPPDADPAQPDAGPGVPDAGPGVPDTAVPDAAVPDAAPIDAAI
ncbi:MAG TPA: hypothetical protein VKZ63_16925 [Kofleriaceae bacterium]|nr:hypothetical protein [Kofleriaceae bacterium]